MNGEESGTMDECLQIPLKIFDKSKEMINKMPVNNFIEGSENIQIPEESTTNSEENVDYPVSSIDNRVDTENCDGTKKVVQIPNAYSDKFIDNIGTPLKSLIKADDSINLEHLQQPAENGEMACENIVEENKGVVQSEESITYSEELEEKIVINFESPDKSIKIDGTNSKESEGIIVIPYINEVKSGEIVEMPLINKEVKQSVENGNLNNKTHVIENVTAKSNSDNTLSQDVSIISNIEQSDSNDYEGTRAKLTTIEISEVSPGAEFSNNHCVDSNGSFAESTASSQAKSEIMQLPPNSVNDNGSDFVKDGNYSQKSEDVDLYGLTDADISEEEVKATDTVSINSDTEPDNVILIPDNVESPQETQPKLNVNNQITIKKVEIESPTLDSQQALAPEIHEIESESEGCDEKKEEHKKSEEPVPLRRSSRAIKRKRYNDDIDNGDDYDEVEIDNPMRKKPGLIMFNNTKILPEMVTKNIKSHQGIKQKSVLFSHTYQEKYSTYKGSEFSIHASQNNHNLYKQHNSNSSSHKSNTVTNQTILPSLTDDMFVVEAPSFIVPYVYEKPSTIPFREFVKVLGKELNEQKAKELDVLEKNKSNEPTDKANMDEKLDEPINEEQDSKEKKKQSRKAKRNVKDDDDDVSWDGESSTESEDDILSDEDDKNCIIKDKDHSVDDLNTATNSSMSKFVSNKSESYFECSLGKFFMDIGYNLVQEYVQNDMLKQQHRKLHREKRTGNNTKATETCIASLNNNLVLSKENNLPYTFKMKKCKLCSFKTESDLILAHHLETPHMKNNIYKCNFCSYEVRSPHDILFHVEKMHNTIAKLARVPSTYQCGNCTFEDNFKGKLARHLISCVKKFKPDFNLAPPFDWEPPAKIPKISKSRNNIVSLYNQNTYNRGQIGNTLTRPMNFGNFAPGVSSTNRPRGRVPMAISQRMIPVQGLPIVSNNTMLKHNNPTANSSSYESKMKSIHQPSISITPLPRQPQPALSSNPSNIKNSFVICEICDGYIKDLEQLRNHMQSIHKVKIHPKMIYNRPPLNCQKCQFRFFTDQGLERHLLGSHGLVTSSMQEAANKGKDAGRCPVCGRVYQWKLLNHVARDHNLTLKPAHLSYKCTVCTATFGMYKQFESHVYSAHSVVARRMMDKNKTLAAPNKTATSNTISLLKPLKINDEITIIPQPIKSAVSKDK